MRAGGLGGLSGDRHLKHFPVSWAGTRIVTPRHLLEILTGETGEVTQ